MINMIFRNHKEEIDNINELPKTDKTCIGIYQKLRNFKIMNTNFHVINLKQHIKSIHERVKYPCEQCNYKATD